MKNAVFIWIIPALFSCASTRPKPFEMVHAYYQVRIAGMVETGRVNVSDTLPVLFIQSVEVPVITAVRMGNNSFSAKPIELNEFPHPVGIDVSTGSRIDLTPGKGRRLFFIDLKKRALSVIPVDEFKTGEILIVGEKEGSSFQLIIPHSIQLAAPRFK